MSQAHLFHYILSNVVAIDTNNISLAPQRKSLKKGLSSGHVSQQPQANVQQHQPRLSHEAREEQCSKNGPTTHHGKWRHPSSPSWSGPPRACRGCAPPATPGGSFRSCGTALPRIRMWRPSGSTGQWCWISGRGMRHGTRTLNRLRTILRALEFMNASVQSQTKNTCHMSHWRGAADRRPQAKRLVLTLVSIQSLYVVESLLRIHVVDSFSLAYILHLIVIDNPRIEQSPLSSIYVFEVHSRHHNILRREHLFF
jgi:hypothetical protein